MSFPDLVADVVAACDRGAYGLQDRLAAEALAIAQAHGDRLQAARLHAAQSLAHYRRNQFGPATEHAASAWRIGEGAGPWAEAEGLVAWARIDWSLGDMADAMRQLAAALEPALTHGDARLHVHVQNLLGLVHADLGDLERSLAFHEAAWQAARRSGVADLELVACTNLAGRWLAVGDRAAETDSAGAGPSEARQFWRRAVDLADRIVPVLEAQGLEHGLPHLLCSQAAALSQLGLDDAAEAVFARQRTLALATHDLSSLPHAALHRSRRARARGDVNGARAILQAGLEEATTLGARVRQADLHLAWSALEEAQGDYRAALHHHQQFHALREACALERAQRKSVALAARLQTREAQVQADQARRRAQALEQETSRLAQVAYTDALTGLDNRHRLNATLPGLHARARETGAALPAAIVDIDQFKAINDRLGHDLGDAVLREIGQLLRQQCRESDLVVRLGGEEFLLAWPGSSADAARAAAERLRQAVRSHDWARLQPTLEVRISVGLAELAEWPDLADGLRAADARLYEAKADGRDCVRG